MQEAKSHELQDRPVKTSQSKKEEADKRFQPPRPYRSAEDTVHDYVADFQSRRPGELPKLEWLVSVTGLSMGTVTRYRKTFRSRPTPTIFSPNENLPAEDA